jgi:peptidoglycan/xylan/chitin deacetylase (PgdA/CDA1 family)
MDTKHAMALTALMLPTLAAVQAGPVLSSLGPLRNRYWHGLAGVGRPDHVALTLDDGPDPASTPAFLQLLARRGVRATFFLLGSMAERAPHLVKEIEAAGHEIGVHGWAHWPLALRGPRATYRDLASARDLIGNLTGRQPRLFRPPYGVMSTAALLSARRLGMRPVLWTCWGEDWRRGATPASVHETVTRDLRGGGTILLHDSDCTSAPGSWQTTLSALPGLLDHCAAQSLAVGPLCEHGW